MIVNYEKQTQPLNEYEREVLLPIMVKCLRKHVGEKMCISNGKMCSALKESGYKASETAIRKIINNIRITGAIPYLVSTGNGYYVATKHEEVSRCIESLRGREDAIRAVRVALEEQIEDISTLTLPTTK